VSNESCKNKYWITYIRFPGDVQEIFIEEAHLQFGKKTIPCYDFLNFRKLKMTIPIISIAGKSNTGKTTLLEKLLPELTGRGYRVATIKHNAHGFEIDHEGKDSWRHKKAGARLTIISSPRRIALIEDVDRDIPVDEIREKYIHDVDLILTEGYKGNPFPKIEVFRSELNSELLSEKDNNLLAVASDIKLDIDVPCFNINDAPGIVDLIEKTFLKKNKTLDKL
jgi:molybdopterin-guanine dinucleotide biosynthesis adapter protein